MPTSYFFRGYFAPGRAGIGWAAAICAALVAWISLSGVAQATNPTFVTVEEDWELVVSDPDPNSAGPQVTCAFSPSGGVDQLYATFELNHQSQPSFVAGGLQLQLWTGEVPIVSRKFPHSGILGTTGETIRWTQRLTVAGGTLTFEIANGTSTTWGPFGGEGYLKASVTSGLTDLNAYSPDVSAANSGIGYASNRVTSLVLKRVRRIDASGQVWEDDTPRVVHPTP